MKRSVLFVLLGVTACSSASAPSGPPASLVTPLMLQPPPIYALLGYRDRLELTSDQIEGLDSIATGLKDENDDLVDELQEKSTLSRNQTGLIVDEEGRPLLDQIRDNNREASEAVGRLLNTTQQEATCELFRLERNSDRRGARSQRARRGVDPSATDIIWRSLESRTWPWCGNTGNPAATAG